MTASFPAARCEVTFKSHISPPFLFSPRYYLFSGGDVSRPVPCRQARLFTSAAPQSLGLNTINVYLGLLSPTAARLSAAARRLLSSPEKIPVIYSNANN